VCTIIKYKGMAGLDWKI